MKKRERVKGRTAAVLGMVLLILFSVPTGMGLSLVRERNQVAKCYYGGDNTFGLLEDLAYCSKEAANMVTVGGKYLPADDPLLTDVRSGVNAMEIAERPAEKAKKYSELTVQVSRLYQALNGMELSEQDREYCDEIYNNYVTYVDLIGWSDYNTEATRFNETLRNAPGRAIAALMGVEELELFAAE